MSKSLESVQEQYTSQGTRFAGWLKGTKICYTLKPMSTTLAPEVAGIVVTGVLPLDYKGRGFSGHTIRTSKVSEIYYVEHENLTVICTRNSTYFSKGCLLSEYGLGKVRDVSSETLLGLLAAKQIDLEQSPF